MDNNQDKNIWQFPESQSDEIFGVQPGSLKKEISKEEVRQNFLEIVRSDVNATIAGMEDHIEDMWIETRQPAKADLMSPHLEAMQILQIDAEILEQRYEHYQSMVDSAPATLIAKIITRMFAQNPSAIIDPSVEKIIEHESKQGVKIYPKDIDVTELKFFLLPDERDHKWYYSQVSSVREKNFTNSYTIRETGIDKSSTFYDESHGRTVNISLPTNDSEAKNLLIGIKKYHKEVTGNVFVKKAAPRFRFGSKSDHDLAA